MMRADFRTAPDRRSELRFPVALDAVVEFGNQPLPASVTNISAGGARLRIAAVIAPRMTIALRLGTLRVEGRVMWRRADCYGIAFATRVNPLEIVRHNHPVLRGVYGPKGRAC